MNVSYRWLKGIAPSIADSPAALAERLTMLGAAVDEIADLGRDLADVIIARVEEVRQHPNADRLSLCTVDAGAGETLQVVCGAPNVEAGRYYPFAPVGAALPGGLAIRKAKIRGEVSQGMLCSARELGLGRDHMGILTLHGAWEPGAPLVESVGLDDARLVLDITANRPDLLSHLGVAREAAPEGLADLRLPAFPGSEEMQVEIRQAERDGETDGVRVAIEDVEGCPRYMGLVIRGVRVGPSPEWLATRLRAVGLRPINNVVDATNYVLLEVGQPLHAFDLERLGGGEVRIRRAAGGERIRTLDGVDRPLAEDSLVIADAAAPVAVAGVMGGEESEVSAETRAIFLECALFEPRTVRRTARRLGLSTDASYRFERGVDPEGLPLALRRAAELIVAVAGGEIEDAAVDLYPAPSQRRSVELRPERVARVLGVSLSREEIAGLLEPIGFRVHESEGALRVEIPGFRGDVTREVDLIEEVARRRGYDSFAEALLPFRPSAVPADSLLPLQQRLRELLARWGFHEARTAAFAPEREGRVPLLNPLSAEESHLRDALAPGLLRRIEHNWARGVRDLRLYEIGTVFFPSEDGGAPREEIRLAAAFTGARRPPHWSGEAGAWDVWDLKGLLEEVAESLPAVQLAPGASADPTGVTDPTVRFQLADATGAVVGGGGRAAAQAVDAPSWAGPVWVLEVVLPDAASVEGVTPYRALPEHPAVERDLALLVPLRVQAAVLRTVLGEAGGALLESYFPFDLYSGKGIPEGTRSLAWRLRFRAPDRTLTDAEVDAVIASVLTALEQRLDVRRR
ncbi:MAG: phenylalanine--tRNA ligase subunit beta [Gemmatimonadota bacterium]|nr:phenylalanine--tRNA ligase subunit beta [Gemmatimonadota bacterium]